jgi:histidyl-tRNA synthetase
MPEDKPRGTRDFSPAEAISIKYITGVAEEVFKRFGFYPIETPAVENLSTLNTKAYGGESTKEIYKIDGEAEGLRYDFTVPLARYVASNKDLTLPFKRYQIGTIWRRDEPQKMRYREFLQADIDIVGSSDIDGDAEIVAASSMVFEELGLRDYIVLLNSRQLLQQILLFFKVPADKQTQVFRILDKMQKISRDDAIKQLQEVGMDSKSAEELLNFVEQEGSNEEKLQKLEANIEGAKEFVGKTRELLSLLGEYKLNGKIVLDLALARGLDYYTSFVWEFIFEENGKRLPTVGGGGRYDNLIGMFLKKNVPATGSSLGISRIFDVLAPSNEKKSYAKVFVAYLGAQNRGYAMNAANTLRGNGIYVDLNTTTRNLSKQLEYAASLGIENVIIVGDKEQDANKLKLRNMATGAEELISLQEAIEKLRE